MIGAHYTAAAVAFRAKETEKVAPASSISKSTKTANNTVIRIRIDQSKPQEVSRSGSESRDRRYSLSELSCRLLNQSEFCYRVSSQSNACRRLSIQSDPCRGISSQSQVNTWSNTADKKNATPSSKLPVPSDTMGSVRNIKALLASMTMLPSEKNTEIDRFSKSTFANVCDAGYDLAFKVILLGDRSVGKTCFLRSLSRVKDETTTGYCTEFREGEMADIVFRCDGRRILVRLVDTGGQERYRSLTSSYYRSIHGCLLLFDVTRQETFNSVMNWYQDLCRYATDQFVSTMLVGTTSAARNRAVTPERGNQLAETFDLQYAECAPEDEVMTSAVVQRLIEAIKKVAVRRVSMPLIIRPQMKRNKKSCKTDVSNGCVCS